MGSSTGATGWPGHFFIFSGWARATFYRFMFEKGQKVVCVDDDFTPAVLALYEKVPVKDTVYTIRTVYVGRGNVLKKDSGKMDGEIGVLLEEIRNPVDPSLRTGLSGELGFRSERFAPLQTVPDEENAEKSWDQMEEERYGRAPLEVAPMGPSKNDTFSGVS
jgi:hypothetical protein